MTAIAVAAVLSLAAVTLAMAFLVWALVVRTVPGPPSVLERDGGSPGVIWRKPVAREDPRVS